MSGDLEPGVWVDDAGALHFDVATILEAYGIEPTPEAVAKAARQLVDFAAEQLPGVSVEVAEVARAVREEASSPWAELDAKSLAALLAALDDLSASLRAEIGRRR